VEGKRATEKGRKGRRKGGGVRGKGKGGEGKGERGGKGKEGEKSASPFQIPGSAPGPRTPHKAPSILTHCLKFTQKRAKSPITQP